MPRATVFLINAPKGSVRFRKRAQRIAARRRRKAASLDRRKRKKYRQRRTASHRSARLPRDRHHKGDTVARRRHRKNPRRHHVRRNPRRHLRRNPRRHRTYRRNASHRRHHYRRNPSIRGVTGAFMEGVKDGLAVWGGQIAARKISNMLGTLVPASIGQNSPALRGIITQGLGAVVTGIAVRRILPKYSKLATAGAFANFIDFAVRQNPTANSFLSAYAQPVVVRGARGYPLPASNVRGYLPGSGVGAIPPLIGLPTNVGMS